MGAGGPDEEDNKWPPWLKLLLCESFFGAGGPDEEDNKWPPWLKPLLCESFFVQCKLHADSHKLIFGRIRWTVMRIRNFAPNMEFMVTPPSSGFPKDLWSPKGE
ncbi:hypothetical protein L6452_28157 [Arctium lappa]|uniref:Uncharacterized protein n=1 Tax=Arctium lappa TaxID=4217 RepID=A0ACB8ZWR7_ARCLA|nr:hypothetical protein L6452_28157 [Arctium lappa]